MTEAQMRETLTLAFLAQWPTLQPLVPFSTENEAGFTLPDSGSFAYFTIQMSTAKATTQGAVGSRRYQRNAWIQVKLWVPAGDRTAGAAALADSVRAIFEGNSFASPVPGQEAIQVFAASDAPGDNDGRWLTRLIRLPLWFAETK